MREASVRVVNRLGLHARAAAKLAALAAQYKSSIILTGPNRNVSADARSLLSLLTLSASMNSPLLVKVEGEDEEDALSAVKELFDGGFGEL